MILHNGRFEKQFNVEDELGKGGFGTVFKVLDRLEEQIYAVKKVRLHLPISDDLRHALKNHKVYREVLALASYNKTFELKHTVRYHSSWLEDLSE
jgi:serine/threonine protein kinase